KWKVAVVPLSPVRANCVLRPSMAVIWSRPNRACAPKTLPVRRWQARQWHTETRIGSPSHERRNRPQLQLAWRVVMISSSSTVVVALLEVADDRSLRVAGLFGSRRWGPRSVSTLRRATGSPWPRLCSGLRHDDGDPRTAAAGERQEGVGEPVSIEVAELEVVHHSGHLDHHGSRELAVTEAAVERRLVAGPAA